MRRPEEQLHQRKKTFRWSEAQDAILALMWERGYSVAQISGATGKSEQACQARAKRIGIHRPKWFLDQRAGKGGRAASANQSSLAEKFYERAIPEPNTGCWLWSGTLNDNGYPIISDKGRNQYAHRLALKLVGRSCSSHEMACHKCDTPSCVNPDHLYAGNHKSNALDASSRGRTARGETHHFCKLTKAAVTAIRESNSTARQLASLYNVSESQINRIRSGKSWEWLDAQG